MNRLSIPTDPLPVGSTDPEILSGFDRLPIDDQVILLLVDVEGFDYRETSDILDIPVDQVIATLYRTRALFEKELTMTPSNIDALESARTLASKPKSDIRKLLKTAVDSIPLPANMEATIIARIRSELLGRPANPAFISRKGGRSRFEKFILLLVMLLFNVVDPVLISI